MHTYPLSSALNQLNVFKQLNASDDFFSIRSKSARDLIWSVLGPPLLNSPYAPELNHLIPELTSNLYNRVDSVEIDFNSPRLGFCFEQLWQHALTLVDIDFSANLQITNTSCTPPRTMGELDLLIRQPKQNLHIELALKFYLGVEDDWIGPNRRDLLSQKIRHTTNHQLPLAQTLEAKDAIRTAGFEPTRSYAILRGCLFYPAHQLTPATLPDDVCAHHWRGLWCPADQLDLLPFGANGANSYWYVLSKPDWISPVLAKFSISRDELSHYLRTYFKHLNTPVCIAKVEEGPYGWAEQQRWMIVPTDWG